MQWINEAVASGARKQRACEELDVSIRTIQRWTNQGEVKADQRPLAVRPTPHNKLSEQEKERILQVANQPEYASLPPTQIVPKLADQGIYLASESSFYRTFNEADQQHHRGRSQAPRPSKAPVTHTASQANEVWSWDITYLPTTVCGLFFYLYLVIDIYSRKIVGWEVHESENGENAAELMQRAVIAERCFKKPLVLHSDNGSPMKSHTLLSKLADLGITPSRSRPRVSNDNPFSESVFRTLKYCPQWPSQDFSSIEAARDWVKAFVDGYNNHHCHSRIKFVTPAQRHRGEDKAILANRHEVYEKAKAANPERWSGETRNWEPVGSVVLNPDRKQNEEAA